MKSSVKIELEQLREWFSSIRYPEAKLKRNYMQILDLLWRGKEEGLTVGGFPCAALYHLFYYNINRIARISYPNEEMESEIGDTPEEIFYKIRSLVVIQLADTISYENDSLEGVRQNSL